MARISFHGGVETPAPKDFRWPGGKRIGIIFRVALEGWSDGKWPGVGPMGNPLRAGVTDWNALYWAEYGPKRGIYRLMEYLDRQKIKATVLINGVLGERHPEAVRAVAAAGHDIAAHSYGMDVIPAYLTEAEERDNIRRSTDLIEAACGVRPKGWVSPRGTPSNLTPRLLAEAGYEWHGDCLDDDLPYLCRFGAHSIVATPSGMDVNDLPLSVRYGNPPRAMLEVFEDNLACLREREHGAEKIDVTCHAHVFGRPAGAWVFERIMEIAKASDDVWIGTRSEAAAHLRAALKV
jgi:peptidoglycan/xylan/chitin deacetylase (PgdA/CDA1 family)